MSGSDGRHNGYSGGRSALLRRMYGRAIYECREGKCRNFHAYMRCVLIRGVFFCAIKMLMYSVMAISSEF